MSPSEARYALMNPVPPGRPLNHMPSSLHPLTPLPSTVSSPRTSSLPPVTHSSSLFSSPRVSSPPLVTHSSSHVSSPRSPSLSALEQSPPTLSNTVPTPISSLERDIYPLGIGALMVQIHFYPFTSSNETATWLAGGRGNSSTGVCPSLINECFRAVSSMPADPLLICRVPVRG